MRIKIAIIGISGKVGKILKKLIKDKNSIYIFAGGINSKTTLPAIEEIIKNTDIIIDFSTPSSIEKIYPLILKYKKPLIIGTTGFNEKRLNYIENLSKEIPILLSYNFSIGIAIIKSMIKTINKKLIDKNFSITISETHHKEKKDAPSGTALMLQNALEKENIKIDSIRKGDVIGKHEILFSSKEESFSIKHTANLRDIFAKGALLTVKYIYQKRQTPGMYNMEDFLNNV